MFNITMKKSVHYHEKENCLCKKRPDSAIVTKDIKKVTCYYCLRLLTKKYSLCTSCNGKGYIENDK